MTLAEPFPGPSPSRLAAPLGGDGLRPQDRSWRAARAPVLVAAALVAFSGVVALRDPFEHHLTPPCPFHAVTGLWCPLCGGTRAVWAASHGQFRLMLQANALLPLVAIGVAWWWLAWLGRATGWWRLPALRGRAVGMAVVAVLIAFTVLRNLPGFSGLAPPSVA